MHLDVRSVTRQAEHPRQFDRLPGDRRRLPPGHREPRLAEKRRRAGGRPRYLNAACRSACPGRGVRGGPASDLINPGLTGADDLAARGAERRRFRSASPTHSRCSKPQNPARPVLAAPAGARPVPAALSGRRAVPQEMRDRPQYLPGLRRTRWIIFAPGAGQPVAAARRTHTATAGRVMSITDPASSRTGPSPAPARAIWPCRHATGDPGFLAAQAIGLFLWAGQLNGTAAKPRRPGRGHPGLPLGRSSPPPQTGEPGKAAELRLLEWETAAPQCGGSPATAKLPCTPSWASGPGFPGRRTHIPARLCVPGGPALRPETGSLR